MITRILSTLLLAACCGFSGLASAALVGSAGPGKHRVALVVGNAKYAEAPLKNPVNDAKSFARLLRTLGFDVIERTDATQKEMNRAVTEFGSRLRADSVAVFYYAGHGLQVRGKNYLIPVDAQIGNEAAVRSEGVDVDAVVEQMASGGDGLNFIILDACRNNPFERRFRGAAGGLAQMDAPKGTFIAYATAPGRTASDGAGDNGLYTQELLRVLPQKGLKVEDAFKQVRARVARATNDQQLPWESSSLTGDFYFNPESAPAASVAAAGAAASRDDPNAEIEFWRATQKLDSPEAYQTYLAEYPDGRFARLARLSLAARSPGAARPVETSPDFEAWKRAQARDTLDAYRNYLDEHPEGLFAPAARARADDRRAGRAGDPSAAASLDAWNAYLGRLFALRGKPGVSPVEVLETLLEGAHDRELGRAKSMLDNLGKVPKWSALAISFEPAAVGQVGHWNAQRFADGDALKSCEKKVKAIDDELTPRCAVVYRNGHFDLDALVQAVASAGPQPRDRFVTPLGKALADRRLADFSPVPFIHR